MAEKHDSVPIKLAFVYLAQRNLLYAYCLQLLSHNMYNNITFLHLALKESKSSFYVSIDLLIIQQFSLKLPCKQQMSYSKGREPFTGLQKRSYKDNLGIIIHISLEKHIL